MATTYIYNNSSPAVEVNEPLQNSSSSDSRSAGESLESRRPRTMAEDLPTTSLTTSPAGPSTLPSFPSSTPLHRSSVSATPSLHSLPREILQQVLSLLPWQSVIHASLSCKTISHVVANSPLLWRQLCLDNYTSWHADHKIHAKLSGSVLDTDWKQLFSDRKLQDRKFRGLFNRVLERQDGRIDFIAGITERGNDARDLMESFRRQHQQQPLPPPTLNSKASNQNVNNDGAPLAHAYWSNEILGSLNRYLALEQITQILHKPATYPLIHGLWAIDMFVAETPPLTLPQLLHVIDAIAINFKLSHPDWNLLSLRNRSLRLAEFVRQHNLVGVRSEETYHDLQNSLISVALCEEDHPSLPLVGHAIYAAVADRVGIDAGLTKTPGHVFVTVRAPTGVTLDDSAEEDDDIDPSLDKNNKNKDTTTSSSSSPPLDPLDPSHTMFLNPFLSALETPLSYLRSIYGPGLAGHGRGVGGLLGFASLLGHGGNLAIHGPMDPTNAQLAEVLKPASTRDMMMRMARNLQEGMRGGGGAAHGVRYSRALQSPAVEFLGMLGINGKLGREGGGGEEEFEIKETLLNPYRASYCAHFLLSLLDPPGGLQHRALYNFVEGFMHHFKETDVPLVVEFMLSAFYGSSGRSMGAGGWDLHGGGEDVLGAAEVGREEGDFVETVLNHVRREDARVRVAKGRKGLGFEGAGMGDGKESKVGEEEEERISTMAAQIDASFGAEPRRQSVPQAEAQQQTSPSSSPTSARRRAVLEGSYSSMKAAAEEELSSSQQHGQKQKQPRYYVGDLFRHRRYRYRAVITGWDATCQASEEWMEQMGVDTLPNGRGQSFYHVLVEDHSTRYVAEENIDLIKPKPRPKAPVGDERIRVEDGVGRVRMERHVELDHAGMDREGDGVDVEDDGEDFPPMEIMRIAGRYFKRWDAENGRFVSNIRDEYPDD